MLKLENISKSYDNTIVLDNLSLDINDGEIVCIYGPSGAGKTTILKIISRLIDYTGNVIPNDFKISYVFQEPRLINSLTVYENLALIRDDFDKIMELLEAFEVKDLVNKYPKMLSGGQKQRINIVRAILNDADIYLLDEPFSSLDTILKMKLMNLLSQYLFKSKGCIFVTHDLDEALVLSNRICILDKCIIKEFKVNGNKEELKQEIIKYLNKVEWLFTL